jgi:anti-sigma-K factor RskA
MTVTDLTPDDRAEMAGALALGLLEGPERAIALRTMLADVDFAAEVERWRARTGDLFDAVPEVDPPMRVWDGIAARTGGARHPSPSLRWWQGGALGGGALAAGLALALIWQQQPAVPLTPGGFAVAQLTGEIDGLRIAARYEPASATLRVRTVGMPDTPTAPELWIVPADGIPRSLGQIARAGETVIVVAEGHRSLINPSAGFALSMEPPSSAPHATPSAPMVARGAIDII